MHDLKQAVNEKLNYDKAQPGGIAGNTEQVIKDFNRDINNYLRNKSDSYAKANDKFSIITDAIDSFKDIAPAKTDFDSITTSKQLKLLKRVGQIEELLQFFNHTFILEHKTST